LRVVAYQYLSLLDQTESGFPITDWQIDQFYQDLSLAKPTLNEKRPQLQKLLIDAQTAPIDYVFVRQLDELGDTVDEVSDRLSDLAALGIRVIMTEQASEALHQTTADIILSSDLRVDGLKLLQAIQRQQRSRQIRQGHAQNQLKALPPPGKAPYGYRRGRDRYALDRPAAAVVKDFFEYFLLYGSLRGAVRHLAQKHGKKISVTTGHRWLTNPVYRGDLAYHNGDTVQNTHVAIISRDEAAQVDRLVRRNRKLPPRTASSPHSLAGLVVCGACQSPTVVTRVTTPYRKQTYLYLRPTVCPQQPRCAAFKYDQVLEQTIQRICQDLPLVVSGAPLPDVEAIKQQLQAAIAQKEAILNQLPDLIASGILDTETSELRTYKLRTEMAHLQAQLAQLPPVNLKALVQALAIPQFWLDLSESERRFYFREFVYQVQVMQHDQQLSCQLNLIGPLTSVGLRGVDGESDLAQ
jgi:DNA invertase Pin-like site-specific DNA recombinase